MKNVIVVFVTVAICLALVACDASDYKKLRKLYAAGNYAAALEIYTKLGEYKDAKDKAASCETEIDKAKNTDAAFLADMEETLLGTINATQSGALDETTLVSTELESIEKYADMIFYDTNLKAIADKYVEGLLVQTEASNSGSTQDYQIQWQTGLVIRYEALNDLYKNYNFLADNTDFVGTYIADLENQRYLLNGYNAVAADLKEQMNAKDFSWEWGDNNTYISCTLKNNTEYTFGVFTDVFFYDTEGILLETVSSYVDEALPGDTYDFTIHITDPDSVENFDWSTYLDYVK